MLNLFHSLSFALVLLICADAPSPAVEELHYDLLVRDKVVGELVARCEKNGQQETFHNLTDVKVHFLKSFEVRFDQTAVFQGGELKRAHSRTLVNGSVHSETTIHRSENHYQVDINGTENTVDQKITYAATMLMLREPTGYRRSFSEQDGSFHPLINKGHGKYLKESPKGDANEYHYRNGKLIYASVNAGWFSFEVKRKQD